MSDQAQGPDWWLASDGKWYPPAPTPPPGATPYAWPGPDQHLSQPSATPPPWGPSPYRLPAGPFAGAPTPNPMEPPTLQPSPVQPTTFQPGPPATPRTAPTVLIVGLAVLAVAVIAGAVALAMARANNGSVATPPTTTSQGAPAPSESKPRSSSSGTTVKERTGSANDPDRSPVAFPPPSDPAAAIKKAGLPELGTEGSQVHYHAHLDIEINGTPVAVAKGIGISRTTISPMHTHDETGVVHIEANEADEFTAEQFFIEWDVKLDSKCIGGFCADNDHRLRAFVNGKEAKDPAAVVFTRHDEVFIWFGKSSDVPDVPSSFAFTGGL